MDNILFKPYLYLTEEELSFFSIKWHKKEVLPTLDEYLVQFEVRLKESYIDALENELMDKTDEFDRAINTAKQLLGEPYDDYSSLFKSFREGIRYDLENTWKISSNEVVEMETSNANIFANQMMDYSYLNALLTDFYDRIEVLKKGGSLKEYYLEQSLIEKGDPIEDQAVAKLPNELGLYFPDFKDLGYLFLELGE